MLIRFAGVPEVFNYPFIKLHDLEKRSWLECSGGSGQMATYLKEEKTDVALMLSEAALKFCSENPQFKIFSVYVETPLVWGCHTKAGKKIDIQSEKLFALTFGISRKGSGSHLMAIYEAYKRNFDFNSLKFKVVGNLEGAREAMRNDEIDLFLWEKQTTDFLVKEKEWDCIGEVKGSWPAFVFVAHEKVELSDVILSSLFSLTILS